MKLTRPTFAKIKWLLRNSTFNESPIKTTSRVIWWEFLRILNRSIIFQFDHSLQIRLLPNDGVARLTYYFDYHEPEIFRFLDHYLRPGMNFTDVGANIGTYALFAAKRVGSEGKVFAFEPQPETFRRLLENIHLNKLSNIIAEPFAVGDISGKVEIVRNDDTAKNYVREIAPGSQVSNICDMVSLDTYFSSLQITKIDYLKVDVEGFEFNVLKGARNILKTVIPSIIQIELYDEFQKRSGSSIAMVQNLADNLGYRFFRLNGTSINLVPLRPKEQPSGDVFLIHESKLQQFQGLYQ